MGTLFKTKLTIRLSEYRHIYCHIGILAAIVTHNKLKYTIPAKITMFKVIRTHGWEHDIVVMAANVQYYTHTQTRGASLIAPLITQNNEYMYF